MRALEPKNMTWAYALSGAIALALSSTWWLHCFRAEAGDVRPGLVYLDNCIWACSPAQLSLAIYLARIGDPARSGGIVASWNASFTARPAVRCCAGHALDALRRGALVVQCLGVAVVYLAQRLRYGCIEPAALANVAPDSAFDTAVSSDQTDWQGYSGESTLSYFTQMFALAVQNFYPRPRLAVAFALISVLRAARRRVSVNFWSICGAAVLYLAAAVLVLRSSSWAGRIQNFDAYKDVSTLEA